MERYIKSITALNKLTLTNKNKDEIDRYSESDIFWATNKNNTIPNRKIRKGNVYQFEFGKNFTPEMSYEHRGLVIGISGKLLYVLPICSYNSTNSEHKNAYHPIDNPASTSNYYLLKSSEFAFLKHDSVLKLNDIRTVSFLRIKYKQENGYIPPSTDTYKAIEKIVFSKYFNDFAFEYDQLKKENEKLTKYSDELEQEKIKLTEEHDALEEKIKAIIDVVITDDENCQAKLKQILGIK